MGNRFCAHCHCCWPATQPYKATFGAAAQRAINENCPACGERTSYQPYGSVSDEAYRERILLEAAARRDRETNEAAFEDYYREHALREFTEELDTWLLHEPA